MRMLIGALMLTALQAQTWEQPRQQVDLYGGGSYRVQVTGAPVFGFQVRQNVGRLVGVGGYYNASREASSFGANRVGVETSSSLIIHDYGAAVEVHTASRLQPYILGTFGGITSRFKISARDYTGSANGSTATSHLAYGGGVGVRYHFGRRAAMFGESRLVRAAVSHADYFVRAVVGVSITLP